MGHFHSLTNFRCPCGVLGGGGLSDSCRVICTPFLFRGEYNWPTDSGQLGPKADMSKGQCTRQMQTVACTLSLSLTHTHTQRKREERAFWQGIWSGHWDPRLVGTLRTRMRENSARSHINRARAPQAAPHCALITSHCRSKQWSKVQSRRKIRTPTATHHSQVGRNKQNWLKILLNGWILNLARIEIWFWEYFR